MKAEFSSLQNKRTDITTKVNSTDVLMQNMNSVTAIVLVVCLSGVLSSPPIEEYDEFPVRPCRMDVNAVRRSIVRVCSGGPGERTMARRSVNVEGPSKPERTMDVVSPYTNREKNDKPASPVASQEPPSSPLSRKKAVVQSAVKKLTDDGSLAPGGEGSSGRGMVGVGTRRRSIRQKRDYWIVYCCIYLCDDEDITEFFCPDNIGNLL